MIFKKTCLQQLFQALVLIIATTLISCSSTPQVKPEHHVLLEIKPVAVAPINPFLKGLSQKEIRHIKDEALRYYGHQWKAITQRSRYVRQPLIETLHRHNYPAELQIIPVVESGYNTYAESEVGATGLWQFMPITAKDLKMTSNQYFDGRRDIKISTEAAGKYLSRQYRRFGSWEMAFAAYHLGPSAVQRRLNKHAWNPAHGLHTMPLPPITKTYIRHILGLIALHEEGSLHFPEPYPTTTITVASPIDLQALQVATKLTRHQLFRFNPELKLARYTDKNPTKISLRIPNSHIKAVKSKIHATPAQFMNITIKQDEHLSKISKEYQLSIRTLLQYNPGTPLRSKHNHEIRLPVKLLKDAPKARNPLSLPKPNPKS